MFVVGGVVEGFIGGLGDEVYYFEVFFVVDWVEVIRICEGFFELIGEVIVVEVFEYFVVEVWF